MLEFILQHMSNFFLQSQIKTHLKPIKEKLEDNIDPNIRAITFNCFENLGTLEIDYFRDFIKKIDDKSKQHLSKLGIRIGAKFFFIPHLMKKKSIELSAILWKVYSKNTSTGNLPLPTD